jgi:hypothetical protein
MDIREIERSQNMKVQEFVEEFNVTSDEAVLLLREFKWNEDKLRDAWYENDHRVKVRTGLKIDPQLEKDKPQMAFSKKDKNKGMCLVCFEPFDG